MNRSILAVPGAAIVLFGIRPTVRAESAAGERDNTPYVMISNLTVTEGDSGLTPFTANLTLGDMRTPLTVKVTATPGTASETDYVFATAEVTLGGDAGVQTVSGFIVGDIEPEGDESFTLSATAVAGDSGVAPRMYSSGGIVIIKDDDQARASGLHVEGATVLEGNQGTSQAEVRIALEPASTSSVSVSYKTQDMTAVAGADYLPTEGTLFFAPGEVLKTISIYILGDTTPEADERFVVVLSQPSMALLGTARGEVVIVNDDAASEPPDALPPTGGTDVQPDSGGDALPVSGVGPISLPAGDGSLASAGGGFALGCACSVGTPGRSAGAGLLLAVVGMLAWRRRKVR